ncbi:MAG: hypothetical protein FWF79_05955 [Defluviitaleaceae bacterium]|nr:hypothetical protein [Defluviitaleaceae bacterium]
MQIKDAATSLAQAVAQLGHNMRTENYEDVHKVNEFAQEMHLLTTALVEKGKNALANSLYKYTEAMLKAYGERNAITLADVLEYEVLHELEKILQEQ